MAKKILALLVLGILAGAVFAVPAAMKPAAMSGAGPIASSYGGSGQVVAQLGAEMDDARARAARSAAREQCPVWLGKAADVLPGPVTAIGAKFFNCFGKFNPLAARRN